MTQSIMIMKGLISIILLYMYTYDNRMHVRFDLFLQPKTKLLDSFAPSPDLQRTRLTEMTGL